MTTLETHCARFYACLHVGRISVQRGRELTDNEDCTRARVALAMCSGEGLANHDFVVVIRQKEPFLPCAWVESYHDEAAQRQVDVVGAAEVEECKDSTAVVVALYPQPNGEAATKDGVAFTFVVDR